MKRIILIMACLIFSGGIGAEEVLHEEYQVKAAFIYNILKFVDGLSGTTQELKFCIVGQNPFSQVMSSIEGKTIKDRKIVTKLFKAPSDSKDCQVFFFSQSEKGSLKEIMSTIKPEGVLTMGDTPGFETQGVVVNFYLQEKSVRFWINLDSAKAAGLKFDSRLLKLANVIGAKVPRI